MNHNNSKSTKEKVKKPIQIFRERHAGISKELKENYSRQTKLRKKISESLKEKPGTIPEISEFTGIPSHEVLWFLMGMKKYGEVVEGEERDCYYEYSLKADEQKKEVKDS